MSEGARNESGSTGVAPAGLLRDAVLGGPGAAVAGGLRAGVLGWLAGGEAVRAALASEGHVDARRRVLTGEVTVAAVLGLCLFSGEGYDSVLARVVPAVAPGAAVPTASALSQARTRLSGQPLKALFAATARQVTEAPGCGAFGLELTAFDGTVFDLAATEEVAAQFAVPSGGRHPQARLVTLACCGTRRLRAAALGSYATSEQELVEQLLPALTPGTLNLADRNLCATRRFVAFPAQPGGIGGQFLDPMAYSASKEVRGREHASKPMAVSRRTERRVGGSA